MRIFVAALVVLAGIIPAAGRSIWQDTNLYTSGGTFGQGDIIVVTVNDVSRMQFSLETRANVQSDVTANPDVTITGFLPKVSTNRTTTYQSGTRLNEQGRFSFDVATQVVRRDGARNVAVAGTRTIAVNGVTTRIGVSGIVDTTLVRGRSVEAVQVADFRLTVQSTGEGIAINRAPVAEGGTASAELTEQEKQNLIIEYLRKILGEMSR